MAEPQARTHILSSDIDARGNVVVWDQGPPDEFDSDLPPDSDEHKAAEARHKAEVAKWRSDNTGPVPLTMHASDAGHALAVEPKRYAIELGAGDSEVEAEVAEIVKRREEAKKRAEEYAAAAQLAADRKVAFATVMAKRRVKAAADEDEPQPPRRPVFPNPSPRQYRDN